MPLYHDNDTYQKGETPKFNGVRATFHLVSYEIDDRFDNEDVRARFESDVIADPGNELSPKYYCWEEKIVADLADTLDQMVEEHVRKCEAGVADEFERICNIASIDPRPYELKEIVVPEVPDEAGGHFARYENDLGAAIYLNSLYFDDEGNVLQRVIKISA